MSTLKVNNITDLGDDPVLTDGILDVDITPPAILQVVSVSNDTEVTTTSGSMVDTGLTADITPSSATSKIMVIVTQQVGAEDSSAYYGLANFQTVRDASVIIESGPNYNFGHSSGGPLNYLHYGYYAVSVLDTPATTSTLTYKTQMETHFGIAIAQYGGARSTITLMEVAG